MYDEDLNNKLITIIKLVQSPDEGSQLLGMDMINTIPDGYKYFFEMYLVCRHKAAWFREHTLYMIIKDYPYIEHYECLRELYLASSLKDV